MIVNDPAVFSALHYLEQITASGKPLMFWIGSGVSAWCGYPVWYDLALRVHEEYVAEEPIYDRSTGKRFLDTKSYPALFSLARTTSNQRYASILKSAFGARSTVPVYDRLLRVIQRFQPLRILTTNVDESLEQHLSFCTTVQRSDLAHAVALLSRSDPFIAKLHGSISAIDTTIFTMEDYEHLKNDHSYLDILRQLFGWASLVVIGSSMSDEYLLSLLQQSSIVKGIFGDGPHFLLGADNVPGLPQSFRLIRYEAQSSIGHRAAIHALENVAPPAPRPTVASALSSAHFLIDVFPPGVPWTTSTTTLLDVPSQSPITAIVRGLGFTKGEIPGNSTTLHDLLVGLTCFEKLYVPLETVPKVAVLLGGDLFTSLIQERALEFIWWDIEEGVAFSDETASVGGLTSFVIQNPDGTRLTLQEKLATLMQGVQVLPSQVRGFFGTVASATTRVREGPGAPLFKRIEHALLLPGVRRTLGFSRFTAPNVIPRWLAYPVLRTARLSRAADTCRLLNAASIKFPFGAKTLAASLLATNAGVESATNVTNYVLYGSFKPAVPGSAAAYRALVRNLLRFRTTAAAQRHRAAVLEHLAGDAGAECAAAIDATLTSAIPTMVMEDSRQQFSELLLPEDRSTRDAPALWGEATGDPIGHWRSRAQAILRAHCLTYGINMSDPCPCGSTVSGTRCCLAALENSLP